MSLRVLLVVRNYRDDGIAVYCRRLARALPSSVTLLTGQWTSKHLRLGPSGQSQPFKEVHIEPTIFRGSWLARARSLDAYLRDNPLDVVHAHELTQLDTFGLVAKYNRIPIVATSHMEFGGSHERARLKKRLFSLGTNRLLADHYVSISSEAAGEFSRMYKIPSRMTSTILTGVDLQHFRPPNPQERADARSTFDVERDDFVVSQIGRLAPVKNPGATLLAFATVARTATRPMKLLYAGEGKERVALESEAERLGVAADVRFLGFANARSVLWASDVLCLPSLAEGLPLVVNEALACGVVPLRSRASGFSDQIAGIPGLGALSTTDVEANAGLLRKLMDEDLRRSVASACVARARERFDEQTMAANWIELYRALAA